MDIQFQFCIEKYSVLPEIKQIFIDMTLKQNNLSCISYGVYVGQKISFFSFQIL